MRYCKNCGHEIKDGQKVCTQCGTPVDQNQPPRRSSQSQQRPPKKPMSTAAWVIIALIIAVAVIALILFFVGKTQMSVTKKADSVASAIKNNNADQLKKNVTSDGKPLTKEEAHAFLELINESKLNNKMADQVKDKAKGMHDQHRDSGLVEYNGEKVMDIKQEGRKWLFFKDYKFDLPRYEIYVDDTSNIDELKFTRDGKTHKLGDNGKVGDFPLGYYELKATKTENGKDYKGQLQVFSSQHMKQANPNFKQIKFYVNIDNSDIYDSDTTLYINNEKHEMDSSEEYGPYPPDEKVEVYAVADVEGKNFTSDKEIVKISGDGDSTENVDLSFDDNAISKHIEAKEKESSKDDDDDDSSSSDDEVTRDNVIDKVESFEGHLLDTDEYTFKEPEKTGGGWGFSYTDKDGDLAGSYKIDSDGYVRKYDEHGDEIDSGYGN
ncbi:TcaA second domain-containing protein [Staphylococcus debuckii]|uniref:TcaA second domain-containing protein n=1 Tax=Staphylococcus debuckii TaxID=2044912 RepID=UPI000F42E275|nr:zinc-ribbon domain-containing protein [Staphylococcus debuckii]AYU54219.1 zinc-ribbon domain-containing protein [Staphylococcus debuckii]